MQSRPVGINRHFHILSVQQHIKNSTGQVIPVDDLWAKLDTLYDLDTLEGMDISEPDESPPSMALPLPDDEPEGSTTSAFRSVIFHPHFRKEFELPAKDFEPLMAERRLRDVPSSADESTVKASKKPQRSKSRNAGLVSGDSESSELTEGEAEPDASAVGDGEDRSPPSRRGKGSFKGRRGSLTASRLRTAAATEARKKKKR